MATQTDDIFAISAGVRPAEGGVQVERDSSQKIAPIAGLLFAIAFYVAGALTGNDPDVKSSGEAINAHFASGGKFAGGAALIGLCAIFFLFFAGGVRARLEASSDKWLSAVFFGGAAIFAAGAGVASMCYFGLVDASNNAQPVVAQTLNVLSNDNFPVMIVGIAVMMWSLAINVLRTGSLPKWFGWLTLVLAILSVAGPAGIAVFFGIGVWALIISFLMMRGTSASAPVA